MPKGVPFPAKSNDGTIFISRDIPEPVQGTYMGTTPTGEIVLAKGIARPCLKDPLTNASEPEMFCDTGAFGRKLEGSSGEFTQLGELNLQRCRLGLQALMFNFANATPMLEADNEHIWGLTVPDLLDKESLRKYLAGIPLALLLDAPAVWKRIGQLKVRGTRCAVYASELVDPPVEGAMPTFKLLPDSARHLLKQINRSSKTPLYHGDMIGRTFLMHRDPALPDASSMFRARYAGLLEWATPCPNQFGIVMHPACPAWKLAGGDFDGDTCAVIDLPDDEYHALRPTIERKSMRMDGKKYHSEDLSGQIVEAAADRAAGSLGSLVLSAMCLLERGVAKTNHLAELASSVQASVEAKKHAIDSDAVVASADNARAWVKQLEADGTKPYAIRAFNQINRAKGLASKIEAWREAVETARIIEAKPGKTPLEAALADRVLAFDNLFEAAEFTRQERRARMPNAIRAAAVAATTDRDLAAAIQAMTQEYIAAVKYRDQASYCVDPDDTAAYTPEAIQVTNIRAELTNACITGMVRGTQYPVEVAQTAVLAYGPIRLAAKEVSADLIERFAAPVQSVSVSLVGEWRSGICHIDDLLPVPNCQKDIRMIRSGDPAQQVEIVVSGYAKRAGNITSTRAIVYLQPNIFGE